MEKRIKQLEMVTQRLARRSKKTTSAILTPYPISNAVSGEVVKGVVLKYLFPCKGTISKCVIDIGKRPKQDITIVIGIINDEKGSSKTIVLNKIRIATDLKLNVDIYDKLSISISYEVEKEVDNITDFWVSLLWTPTVKDTVIKQFLIDEIEHDLEEKKDARI